MCGSHAAAAAAHAGAATNAALSSARLGIPSDTARYVRMACSCRLLTRPASLGAEQRCEATPEPEQAAAAAVSPLTSWMLGHLVRQLDMPPKRLTKTALYAVHRPCSDNTRMQHRVPTHLLPCCRPTSSTTQLPWGGGEAAGSSGRMG